MKIRSPVCLDGVAFAMFCSGLKIDASQPHGNVEEEETMPVKQQTREVCRLCGVEEDWQKS